MINKLNFLQLRLIPLILCVSILSLHALGAEPHDKPYQDQECHERLDQAEESYYNGDLDQAILLARQCSEDKNVSNDIRVRSYKILARSFLIKEDMNSAKNTVLLILRINPEYQATIEEESPRFVKLVNETRVEHAQMTATEETSTINPWIWVGAGGVAATAIIIMVAGGSSGDEEPTTTNNHLPLPPAFPSLKEFSMKLKLIIILFLVFFNRLVAQTPVPGGTIDGDTWTPQNSPYIIQGDITIADLNIEAGVEVRFESNYKFEVTGSLNALGFYSDSIIFKPDSLNRDSWEGIKFKNTSIASSLKYCRIEGGSTHGLSIEEVSPIVSNCRIVHNVENGIKLKDASVEIKHCVINSNSGHGIELDASQISATNSIISGNTLNGIFSRNNNDAIITVNSVITDNQGIGISSEKADLTIANSIVFDNNEQIFIVEQIPDVTYSAIQGASIYPGVGNINSPPEFENYSIYTLSPISPCVDAGNFSDIHNDKYFPPSWVVLVMTWALMADRGISMVSTTLCQTANHII